jgi:chemotaxis family two-component system response regulator Rcp1
MGDETMEPPERRIEILLVEDNPGDVALLQESFLEYVNVRHQLTLVNDGEAALAFLRQQNAFANAPRPHLILLDIGLPKRDGWEVLAAIRATPSLAEIPVVILTGILTPVDEEQRATLRPTLCLLKPRALDGYENLTKSIEEVMSRNNS